MVETYGDKEMIETFVWPALLIEAYGSKWLKFLMKPALYVVEAYGNEEILKIFV